MLGNHLLGLYEKALDPADSWKTRLEKTKALGFDYMEISIDESDARLARLDWTSQQRRDHSAVYVPQCTPALPVRQQRPGAPQPGLYGHR